MMGRVATRPERQQQQAEGKDMSGKICTAENALSVSK